MKSFINLDEILNEQKHFNNIGKLTIKNNTKQDLFLQLRLVYIQIYHQQELPPGNAE